MQKYVFSAIRGVQANKEYYAVMVPLKVLNELFIFNGNICKPEQRAQRKLNENRILIIKNYIVNNRNAYVFSALAASIDGEFYFEELTSQNRNIGNLVIDKSATFLINDGQHRLSAIVEALKVDKTLGDETITIVFFKDNGLIRSQQIFADLNKHAIKTSKSIAELYDSTDNVAKLTREIMQRIPFLDKYTDKEKDNLSKYSAALFVFNTFYKANLRIIGKDRINIDFEFVVEYWKEVVNNMELWQMLENGDISKLKLRSEYLVCQAVVIEALGILGNYFYNYRDNWKANLRGLKSINWRRDASVWQGKCLNEKGNMVKSEKSIVSTAEVIKISCNIK